MKTIQNLFVLGLVALLVLGAGCNVHGKYTQTGPTKDGKQEVKTYEVGVETSKKEEPAEVKDSDKPERKLAEEIEVLVAQLNAKVAALQAKTKTEEPLVAGGIVKEGKVQYVPFKDFAVTQYTKALANPEAKAETRTESKATEADPNKAPSTEKKRETKTCSK